VQRGNIRLYLTLFRDKKPFVGIKLGLLMESRHKMSEFSSVTRRALRGAVCAAIATGFLGVLSQSASAQTAAATGPGATAGNPNKPAIFLIGDSTTRNGSFDNGATAGQFGWGHMLHYYFDTSRIYVVNDAMGGTSSRSYQTTANLWPIVLPKIQPGDFVLMAFGHNDSSATLRGNGEDTQPLAARGGGARGRGGATGPATGTATAPTSAPATGASGEVMHSFGWYMRQYIQQTKAKGATPIVLSLIPRNRWSADGKVSRNTNDYALWAQQAAEQEKVAYIPLNDLIADRYDKLGQAKVQADLFPPNEAVHPNWAGAKLNAETVVEGIKALKDCPLKDYLLANPKCPDTPDVTPPARGELGPSARAPAERPDRPATPATATAPK
jgi:rhamnogalacturonan acetylesterase